MNEKLEKLNQEIEKTEKKLRWTEQEEKRLIHQAKALTRIEAAVPSGQYPSAYGKSVRRKRLFWRTGRRPGTAMIASRAAARGLPL